MKIRTIGVMSLGVTLSICLAGLLGGCSGDSADAIIRDVDIRVNGVYAGPVKDGKTTNLVRENTGKPIASINLLQTGDQLEGIDNNGFIFRGTIGQVSANSATISLEGRTTAGAEGIISGVIDVSGSQATMEGTWAEPTLFSTVFGRATVPTNQAATSTSTDTTNGG